MNTNNIRTCSAFAAALFGASASLAAEIHYAAAGSTGTYCGQGFGITVDVSTPLTGATVEYSTAETGPWQDAEIKYTNACAATPIWFKISAEGYSSVTNSRTVAIAPRQLDAAYVWLTLPPRDYVYDGTAKTPGHECGEGDPSLITEDDFDVVFTDNVKAGTAKATFTGKRNYTGTVEEEFDIGKAPLVIGAEAKTKVFGTGDPPLTYTNSALFGTDRITGALAREAGDAVGAHPILQGTLTAGENYEITYVGADLTITPAEIRYAASGSTGTYCGQGFGITVDVSTPASGAAVQYATSETGPWQDAEIKYTNACAATPIWFKISAEGYSSVTNSRTMAIAPKQLDAAYVWLTLPPQDYVYDGTAKTPGHECGEGDPSLITEDDFDVVFTDNVKAGTAKATFTGKRNYTGMVEEEFDIGKAPLAIGAEAKTKVFGAGDPPLTYTNSALVGTDRISGALAREAGETVGAHPILQGTLTAGDNYEITYVGANLTITPATIHYAAAGSTGTYCGQGFGITVDVSTPSSGATVQYSTTETGPWQDAEIKYTNACAATPIWFKISAEGYTSVTNSRTVAIAPRQLDAAYVWLTLPPQDYVYDGTEKTPGHECGEGDPSLITEDDFDVVFTNNVNAGTAKATFTGKRNYTGTVEEEFIINPAMFTLDDNEPGDGTVPQGGESKFDTTSVYDGLGHTIDTNALVKAFADLVGDCETWYVSEEADVVSDILPWSPTPPMYTNVGVYRVLYKVTKPNYEDYEHVAMVTITPRPLVIGSEAKTKVFGAVDPPLTYTNSSLVGTDRITGALARDAGDAVGTYAILQGTLTAGDNYAITYVGANLTISRAPFPGNGEEPGDGTVPQGGESKFDMIVLYDGQGHTIDTNKLAVVFDSLMEGGCLVEYALDGGEAVSDLMWTSAPPLFTNVCERIVWYRVTNSNYEDFRHEAKVTITRRQVTLSSSSAGRVYDGTPLTANEIEIGGDGFASGEGADCTITGSQTDVGSSRNTFTYTLWENTLADNYDIICAAGTLVITSPPSPVFRFYSPVTKGHFFTMNEREKNDLIAKSSHIWNYEGIAYYAYPTQIPGTGTVPLYRFWSPGARGHFYTRNETEKNGLIATAAHIWNYEGIAYYVAASRRPGSVPVYRFWAPGAKHHFYTLNEGEKNGLIANASHIWNYEGIAFYAWPTQDAANARNAVVIQPEAAEGEDIHQSSLSTNRHCSPTSSNPERPPAEKADSASFASLRLGGEDADEDTDETTFALLVLPDESPLPNDGVFNGKGGVVEICALKPEDGVFASELEVGWDGDAVALRLLLPAGVFSLPLWDDEANAVVDGMVEDSFDFELPMNGSWYLINAMDSDGNEVFSRWIRAFADDMDTSGVPLTP